MDFRSTILNPGRHCRGSSLGLLALRVIPTSLMLPHGWGKLAGFADYAGKFPDPIGLGSSTSLVLAIFAELVCALLLIVGLGTRVAAIPLLITMLVAAFVVHGGDPFAKKELALLYAATFLPLLFTGAGEYSIDAKLTCARGYCESSAPADDTKADSQPHEA